MNAARSAGDLAGDDLHRPRARASSLLRAMSARSCVTRLVVTHLDVAGEVVDRAGCRWSALACAMNFAAAVASLKVSQKPRSAIDDVRHRVGHRPLQRVPLVVGEHAPCSSCRLLAVASLMRLPYRTPAGRSHRQCARRHPLESPLRGDDARGAGGLAFRATGAGRAPAPATSSPARRRRWPCSSRAVRSTPMSPSPPWSSPSACATSCSRRRPARRRRAAGAGAGPRVAGRPAAGRPRPGAVRRRRRGRLRVRRGQSPGVVRAARRRARRRRAGARRRPDGQGRAGRRQSRRQGRRRPADHGARARARRSRRRRRRRPPSGGGLGARPAASAAGPGAPVNINTASLEELDALDGVGPSTAQKIIDYRTANGPFKTIDDIKNVSGIGDAKFAADERQHHGLSRDVLRSGAPLHVLLAAYCGGLCLALACGRRWWSLLAAVALAAGGPGRRRRARGSRGGRAAPAGRWRSPSPRRAVPRRRARRGRHPPGRRRALRARGLRRAARVAADRGAHGPAGGRRTTRSRSPSRSGRRRRAAARARPPAPAAGGRAALRLDPRGPRRRAPSSSWPPCASSRCRSPSRAPSTTAATCAAAASTSRSRAASPTCA